MFFMGFFKPHRVNQLIIGSIGDATYLNPVLAQDSASSDINSFVFNGLLKYDRNLNIVGDLAESWEVKEGNKPVIIFHLKKGVLWQDGEKFTADDVRFTYETIMNPKTNTVRRSDFEKVERVEVPDPYTFIVYYKEPFAPGLQSWMIGIIPKHILQGKDINRASFNRNPIGTGPFIFQQWISDEKITLKANPNYFEGRPYLDGIVYRIIPETSLMEIELLTGGIDYTGIYPYQYKRISHNPSLRVYKQLSHGYSYIGYNLKNPLFKDKRVRKAITLAINREEMVKYILYGLGVVATGPFTPDMWYYNHAVHPLPYDPKKAKKLLAEAGFKDIDGDGILEKDGKPFSFTLITNSGNDIRKDIGVMVQRYLKEVGIDVKLRLYEWSVFLTNWINSKNFDACILGWSLSLDPDQYEIWHSSQIKSGFNFISYKNLEVDRLLEEGRRTFDKKKREKIYKRFHKIINEDQPYTFLFVPESTPALNKKFFLVKKEEKGRKLLKPIKMEKAGLMVDIIKWYVPKENELTP